MATKKMAVKKMVAKKPAAAMKKASPMKQGLPAKQKTPTAKKKSVEINPKDGLSRPTPSKKIEQTPMAKGPSKGSMQASKNPKPGSNTIGGRSLEKNGFNPGTKIDGDMSKSGRKYPSKDEVGTGRDSMRRQSIKDKLSSTKRTPMKQTNPRTGQKPFYNMSAELATEIDRRTVENKRRKETEVKASSDSSAVAKITKGNMFSKQLAGNAAANKTRWRAGFNDQKVEHGQQQGTGMWHEGGTEAFYRRNQVESETPRPVLNPKTGQYGYNKKDTGRKEAKGPSVYVARYKGYE